MEIMLIFCKFKDDNYRIAFRRLFNLFLLKETNFKYPQSNSKLHSTEIVEDDISKLWMIWKTFDSPIQWNGD